MPLFVFISGYFSSKKTLRKYAIGIMNLIVPLAILQLTNILLHYIFLGERIGFYSVIIPYWTLWYIFSMIIWRSFIQFVPEGWLSKLYFVLISLVVLSFAVDNLHLVNTQFNGRIFSIQRTFVFFPYFYLGYASKGKDTIDRIRCIDFRIIILLISAASVIFYFFISRDIDMMQIFSGADYCGGVGIRIISIVLAFICSIVFIWLVRDNKITSKYGQYTLYIYLLHGLFVEYIFVDILKKQYGIDFNILSVFIITIAIVGICVCLSKVKAVRLLSPFNR